MSSKRSGKHSSPHDGHRRRHTQAKFPPQDYTDYTRADIAQIAPLLLPQPAHETRSAYEKRVKKGIADLPSHLHSKLSLLSSFCSLHSKLSPAPIISLFNSLRGEIEDEVPKTWGPLVERGQLSAQKREMVEIVQHLAALWLGPKFFQARFDREPRRVFMKEKPSKCCACTLTAMAGDFQTQVAMASLFIGRINQKLWESSKRIVWFMEWTSARLPASRREDAKGLIWEIGKKFRITRLGAEGTGRNKKKPNLEMEEESELGPGTASYIFSLDRELREEQTRGRRRMIDSKAQQDGERRGRTRKDQRTEADDVERAIQLSLEEQEKPNKGYDAEEYGRPQASSVYSVTTSGERPPSISIDKDVDGILALYEGSMVSEWNAEDEEQYSRQSERPDDAEPPSPREYHMTHSRIQSMFDKSFNNKPWDGPRLG